MRVIRFMATGWFCPLKFATMAVLLAVALDVSAACSRERGEELFGKFQSCTESSVVTNRGVQAGMSYYINATVSITLLKSLKRKTEADDDIY